MTRCPHGHLPPCMYCDGFAADPDATPAFEIKLTGGKHPSDAFAYFVDGKPFDMPGTTSPEMAARLAAWDLEKQATWARAKRAKRCATSPDGRHVVSAGRCYHCGIPLPDFTPEEMAEALRRYPRWETSGDPRPRPGHWNCRSTIRPAYHYDRHGGLHCKHGRILNGDSCVACERDCSATHRSQGPHGASYIVELITDPTDRRGDNAKRINAL